MPANERKAYVEFEKGVQDEYCKVRHRLRNAAGSHTMEVLTLLSKFRQVIYRSECGSGLCAALTPSLESSLLLGPLL